MRTARLYALARCVIMRPAVSTRAFAWLSMGVVAVTPAGQWLLGVFLAEASGQSNEPAPSLAYDWRWLPLWLLPVEVLVVGLLVSVIRRRFGRGFRTSWTYTLGFMVASVFVFWLLYGITDQRVVRAVPPSVEDWSLRFLHIG